MSLEGEGEEITLRLFQRSRKVGQKAPLFLAAKTSGQTGKQLDGIC